MNLTTDDFLQILGHLGLEHVTLHIDDTGASCAGHLNYAGFHDIYFLGEAEDTPALIRQVIEYVRDKLLSLSEYGGLDFDATSGVLSGVAILDELLNGPSTGVHPGQQALTLNGEDE